MQEITQSYRRPETPSPEIWVPFPARRGRRAARDLEDYAEDLEEELARVRRELQKLRRAETPEG
jgi:hypothetical protein